MILALPSKGWRLVQKKEKRLTSDSKLGKVDLGKVN